MPDIKIRNSTYSGVPMVHSPDANGGADIEFYYTGDATLDSGGKMAKNYTAYANGVKVTGTAEERASADLTASGATVTAPAGIYYSSATKTVPSGSATAPATISGTSASVSTGTNTLTLSKTISVTPSKAVFDYISFFSFCINAFKIDGKITYFATNLLFLQQLLK